MNQSQRFQHSLGKLGPVYSEALALARPPLLLVVCTTRTHRICLSFTGKHGGCRGCTGLWQVPCSGSAVFYSCGLGHFPSVPSLWFLVCQRGLGGEDVMAKPRPGWGLSFLSHLSGCYVYAALRLLPGERGLCLHNSPEHGQPWTGLQRSCGASRRKGSDTHERCVPIVHWTCAST